MDKDPEGEQFHGPASKLEAMTEEPATNSAGPDSQVEYKQPSLMVGTDSAFDAKRRPLAWAAAAVLFALIGLFVGVSPLVSLGPNVISISLTVGFAALTVYAWRKDQRPGGPISQKTLLIAGVVGVLIPFFLVGYSLMVLAGRAPSP